MRLLALSDLHVGYRDNRGTLEALPAFSDDHLIVAGDVGETVDQLKWTWDTLLPKFRRLTWVPGNHELYVTPRDPCQLRGAERYERLVELCREYGVVTPEDPYETWPDGHLLVPTFTLYDYSFAPDGLDPVAARAWAREEGIVAADEAYLHPDPYPTREAWCWARLDATRRRLDATPKDRPWVYIGHFPLRRDLVRLFAIPRFSPWCGTRLTEDWHRHYPIDVVVSGHLHMRATDWRDGVRFEEASLGYPRHWRAAVGAVGYLREVLPGPPTPPSGQGGPVWHR